ncbi:MAG: flagellar protein FlgN [Lachnospiraceae bacterium]|jgi:flagellar biosynthesis/type III secretory pathway chaperone|nr:flagellar protein FlgN [Lachnospiraceae bacterium]
MAGLMDNLISLLGEECKGYEELVKVSSQKAKVIIDGDIDKLQKITVSEQELTDKLQYLENRRQETVKDIAVVINRENENLTISRIAELMDNQPDVQKKLFKLRDRLKTVLTDMKRINDQNEVLLNQAIEMVEFDISLVKSMRQAPETANYNKNAYNTGALLGGSGFDFKQ